MTVASLLIFLKGIYPFKGPQRCALSTSLALAFFLTVLKTADRVSLSQWNYEKQTQKNKVIYLFDVFIWYMD